VRGYLSCERCGWARIYARFSVARLPQYCPQCGHRVMRERHPTAESPALAPWHAVAQKLSADQHPPPRQPPPG
jgi:DNA-directed RNA polymerase subunit RPC12/RpoP